MAGGSSKNARMMIVLLMLVLGVAFFTLPVGGKTGWQRMSAMVSGEPAKATKAPNATRLPGYSTYPAAGGRPRVPDGVKSARPMHQTSRNQQADLDRLINRSTK